MTPKIRQHASNALEWAKGVYVPIILAVLGGGLLRTSQTAQKAETASSEQMEHIMALSGQIQDLQEELYATKQGIKPRVAKVENRVRLLEVGSRLERPRTTLVPQRAAAVGDTVASSPGLVQAAGNALLAPFRWFGRKIKGE